MERIQQNKNLESGFTLIEVVAVLILIGVLGAVAANRFAITSNDFSLASEVETFKSHLRYAQVRAMGDTVPWSLNLATTNYTLQRDSINTPLPGLGTSSRTLTSNITLSPAGTQVDFDSWGSPGASDVTLTLRTPAGDSQQVTVTANTGYIQ